MKGKKIEGREQEIERKEGRTDRERKKEERESPATPKAYEQIGESLS